MIYPLILVLQTEEDNEYAHLIIHDELFRHDLVGDLGSFNISSTGSSLFLEFKSLFVSGFSKHAWFLATVHYSNSTTMNAITTSSSSASGTSIISHPGADIGYGYYPNNAFLAGVITAAEDSIVNLKFYKFDVSKTIHYGKTDVLNSYVICEHLNSPNLDCTY